MYSSYKRIVSLFPEHADGGEGQAGPGRARNLLEPFRGKVSAEVFGEPYRAAGQRRLGQRPHAAETGQRAAARRRLQARRRRLRLPDGKPLTIEFLDFSSALQPHTRPSSRISESSASRRNIRIVDPAQYKSRTDNFDFDVVTAAFGGSLTPGADCASSSPRRRRRRRLAQSRRRRRPGRRRAGRKDRRRDRRARSSTPPAARSTACCAPAITGCRCGTATTHWVAYWDVFSRPDMPAETRRRRARHLVVGRREGEGERGQRLSFDANVRPSSVRPPHIAGRNGESARLA